MATSLGTIINKVRRWIHEPTEAESFFTNALITNVVNLSYRTRVAQIIMAYEGGFTEVAVRDFVEDQSVYSYPPGLVRLRRLDLVTEDGTQVPLSRHERHTERINPGNSTEPYTFRPMASGFVIEPTPGRTVTNGLRIEYQATPGELQALSDNISADYPEIYVDLLVLDAVAYLMDSEGNLEDGIARTVLRARRELEFAFDKWIHSKITKQQEVQPDTQHYLDA